MRTTLFDELDADCNGLDIPTVLLVLTTEPEKEGPRLFTALPQFEVLWVKLEAPGPLRDGTGHVFALELVTAFFLQCCTSLAPSGFGAGGGGTNCPADFLKVNLANREFITFQVHWCRTSSAHYHILQKQYFQAVSS